MNSENNLDNNSPLLLKIIDDDGNEQTCHCDMVKLNCKYDLNDKNGGSLGIKKGHAKALIALSKDNVRAFLNGEEIFKSDQLSGIAKVENNTIIVLKD